MKKVKLWLGQHNPGQEHSGHILVTRMGRGGDVTAAPMPMVCHSIGRAFCVMVLPLVDYKGVNGKDKGLDCVPV